MENIIIIKEEVPEDEPPPSSDNNKKYYRVKYLTYQEWRSLRHSLGLFGSEKLYASYLTRVGKDITSNLSLYGVESNRIIACGDRMEYHIAMLEYLNDFILVSECITKILTF